jgi:cytochrome c biogenesis protein ResB
LIGLVLAVCLGGVLIPQIAATTPAYFEAWRARSPISYYLVHALQLDRVFTSYWFLLLIFFLFLAITISLYRQFCKALFALRDLPSQQFTPQITVRTDYFSTAVLISLLKNKRFMVQEYLSGSDLVLKFSRHRWNNWGSFIFHCGLLVIIMASLLTFAFQKSGFVQLIQGDTFSGREEDFLSTSKGILAGRFDPAFTIHLQQFSHVYWDTGELRDVKSDASIDRHGWPFTASLIRGESLNIYGVNLYQSSNFGYTVKISLLPGGSTKDSIPTYFSLDMAPAGKALKGSSDFPTSNYILDMSFFPDRGGRSVKKGNTEAGSAALKPGEETLVDGSRFRFEEVRNWSGLILTENRFIPLVYIGFLMSTAGLFMMFFFIPQEIFVSTTAEKEGGFTVAVAVKTRMGGKILLADTLECIRELLGRVATKG